MKKNNLIILTTLLAVLSVNAQKSKAFSKTIQRGNNTYYEKSYTINFDNEEFNVGVNFIAGSVPDKSAKLVLSVISDKINWTDSLKADYMNHLTGIAPFKNESMGKVKIDKVNSHLVLKFRISQDDNDGVTHCFPFVYKLNLKETERDLSLETRAQFELEKEPGIRSIESANRTTGLNIKYNEFEKAEGISIDDCPVVLEVNHNGNAHVDTINTEKFAKSLSLKSVSGFKVIKDESDWVGVKNIYAFKLHYTGNDDMGQVVNYICPIQYDYKATYQEKRKARQKSKAPNSQLGEYFTLGTIQKVIWHFN